MATAISKAVGCADNSVQTASASPGALVMGGDYRGLGLVRSLGRHGIPVWVVNQEDQRLAGTSRYALRTLFYPSWSDERGIDFLLELARKCGLKGWLLFPTSDDSVRLIASHHEQLSENYRMTVPPWETLQWAVDKRLMHRLADKVGVNHPRTYYPRDREDLASLELSFPVILKPATRDQFNRMTAAKAWPVDNLDALRVRYDEACQLLRPEMLMVQELIPGGGESQFSFAAICEDGRPLASLVARRTRQFPMDFGRASTFVETVDEPDVIEPASRFLQAIRFTGLVEVEFKRDRRTGTLKLLDVNPRVWGWYSLCGRAGVDFGYLLWLLYQGQPIPKVRAEIGVRWIRMNTDLLASFGEMCSGRLAIREYLRSIWGSKESAIFASDDLLPGLLEVPLMFYLVGKRFFRGDGI